MMDIGQELEDGESWCDVDDAALAAGMRADAGDVPYAAAWREFERRHLGAIQSFIEARGRDLDCDARDDVLQLTMLRIQQKIDRYAPRGGGSLRSWCIKIADNFLKDAWRGRLPLVYDGASGMPVLVPFDEIAERYGDGLVVSGNDGEATALTAASPHDDVHPMTERDQMLWAAFDALSEVDRAVLWCRIVHDDSDERVAGIVGKPTDHVRKIFFKAEIKLGREFEKRMAKRRQAS